MFRHSIDCADGIFVTAKNGEKNNACFTTGARSWSSTLMLVMRLIGVPSGIGPMEILPPSNHRGKSHDSSPDQRVTGALRIGRKPG